MIDCPYNPMRVCPIRLENIHSNCPDCSIRQEWADEIYNEEGDDDG